MRRLTIITVLAAIVLIAIGLSRREPTGEEYDPVEEYE